MLPARHRMRDAKQYRAVLRNRQAGRAGGTMLVVHAADTDAYSSAPEGREGPRVGFVVSKSVGNSVVRSRTKRVLRHLMRDELDSIPEQFDLVIRANASIAGVESLRIRPELQRLLVKAQSRVATGAKTRDDAS